MKSPFFYSCIKELPISHSVQLTIEIIFRMLLIKSTSISSGFCEVSCYTGNLLSNGYFIEIIMNLKG